MEAINNARVMQRGFFAFLYTVLCLFFAGNLSAQTTPTLSGKVVSISKEHPTRSHIALLITRNANNWTHTSIYRQKLGKLVLLSNKDNKSLRIGDLVVVPWALVRTHADTLNSESASAMCQRKYNSSDCAWRVAKINSLPIKDTALAYAQREVYVPNSFIAKSVQQATQLTIQPKTLPNAGTPRHTAATISSQNLGRIIVLVLILLTFCGVLVFRERQRRITRLSSFLTELELDRDMRRALPRNQYISWVIKPWSWAIRGSPPTEMNTKDFGHYKETLASWILTSPLRHLELSDSYYPISQSSLQGIKITAVGLDKWNHEVLPLAERQQIVAEMEHFAEKFKESFSSRCGNAAIGGPESIEFSKDYYPEKGALEIRIRPHNRPYPNYNLHQSIIDQDVNQVLAALQISGFQYDGCTPDSKWVVLHFTYEIPPRGTLP